MPSSAGKPSNIKKKPDFESKKSGFLICIDKINNFLLILSYVPLKEKLFFVQYLEILLKAGISLLVSLRTLAKQTENKYFSKIINDVADSVEKGTSFAESLKPYEKVFGELFINMIDAGELSGKLEEVLGRIYIQTKKHHELLSKVKGALTYPVAVILVMIVIAIFMMTMVMPQLTAMLMEFDVELPLPTKILITASNITTNHGVLVLIALVAIFLLIIKLLRTYKGKYYFQAVILKTPIISPIIKKINLARFARTTSSLLKTDSMITKTFEITAKTLGNLHYRKAINEMSSQITKGKQINKIISAYPKLFPPIVNQIIFIGEQTGELDNILTELAEFYETEVNKVMDNLPSIIEPVLILILGCGAAIIALAIMMPMYTLTEAI